MSPAIRGRPADPAKQAEQKKLLLDAARRLFSEKSYRAITIREVAELAGVNSAMVSYYFESKQGLFTALLDAMAELHFGKMTQIVSAENPIRAVIGTLIKMLSENPGMARMIHDEVLQDDSVLREAFLERFPKRMASFLPQLILQQTPVTNPLRAKYLAFNLVSMIITPFIGAPVRKYAWQISDEEIADPAWADHIYAFFIQGCTQEQIK